MFNIELVFTFLFVPFVKKYIYVPITSYAVILDTQK
jgi:hypothetical protein